MSFKDCIDEAEANGELDPDRARRIREIYDQERESLHNYPPDEADAEAGRRAQARMEDEALESARRKRLMMKVASEVRQRILERHNDRGEFDPGAALPDLIEHFGTSPYSSVNDRYNAVIGRMHGMMNDLIERFERDWKGSPRNEADMVNVIREAFGEDTGDQSARELFQAWSETAEWARVRRNAAGGHTPKRENWGLPQTHNALRIASAGKAEWSRFIRAELDRGAMVDGATGQPISAAALDDAIDEAFDAITSDGWSRREAKFTGGGMALANRRAEARFFVFRDADAWMRYNERFGDGDPFSVMMAHLDAMARDIAQMEILGPNPSAMLRYAEQIATKEAMEGRAQARTTFDRFTPFNAKDGPLSKVRSGASLMRSMAAEFNGTARAPIDGKLARSIGTLINVKYSAQLGSAFLTAMSDDAYGRIARSMVGMPEAQPLAHGFKLMDPRNEADRRIARRSGLIAQEAAGKMLGQARYVDQFTAHQWSKRLADVSLRVSLLSPETQAMKWAFGMEFFGWTADMSGRRWGELDDKVRAFYERHGMGEHEWDVIRRAPQSNEDAGGFITPEDIARIDADDLNPDEIQRVAERYLEVIHQQTQYAVPSASLRGRAFLMPEGVRPGTLVHTLLSSVAMYKSFVVSMSLMYMSAGRAVAARAGGVAAGRLAVKTLLYTTVLGAGVVQLKELWKGRDPRPMNNVEFWQAAMLQGGGLGIYGDYMFSNVNRYGYGLPATVAGPVVETVDDLRRLTIGNLAEGVAGDETRFGNELVRILRRNTPGASNWYTRLATDRLIFDQLQQAIDPEADARFRRQIRRYERDYGQEFWWSPGEAAPDRAPDLTNALTGAPE